MAHRVYPESRLRRDHCWTPTRVKISRRSKNMPILDDEYPRLSLFSSQRNHMSDTHVAFRPEPNSIADQSPKRRAVEFAAGRTLCQALRRSAMPLVRNHQPPQLSRDLAISPVDQHEDLQQTVQLLPPAQADIHHVGDQVMFDVLDPLWQVIRAHSLANS